MSKNFRETLNEQLRDPAFQAEWETLEPERQIIRAIIEGRESFEQQFPDAAAQCAQLTLQHGGEDAGQVAVGLLRIQIAGVELDRFLNVLILRGAVAGTIVIVNFGPVLIRQPDGVPVFILVHA